MLPQRLCSGLVAESTLIKILPCYGGLSFNVCDDQVSGVTDDRIFTSHRCASTLKLLTTCTARGWSAYARSLHCKFPTPSTTPTRFIRPSVLAYTPWHGNHFQANGALIDVCYIHPGSSKAPQSHIDMPSGCFSLNVHHELRFNTRLSVVVRAVSDPCPISLGRSRIQVLYKLI
jgi:hypothetical protein